MDSRILINATFDPVHLRRALRRRQALASHTPLFDHSLPESLLTHGLNRPTSAAPRVREGGRLSPYAIRLARPASEAAWFAAEAPSFAVNLLVPESFLTPAEDLLDAMDDLVLQSQDVADQLAEEWAALGQNPLSSPFERGTREMRSPLPEGGYKGVGVSPEPVAAFSVEALAPREAPADFATYLDLPEEEESLLMNEVEEEAEEEAPPDLVLITAETLSQEQPAPTPLPMGRFAFRLPEAWPRALAAFVLLSFGFVLPLHAMQFVSNAKDAESTAREAGNAGLAALSAAGSAAGRRDAQGAADSFAAAEGRFTEAQDAISELGGGLSALVAALPSSKARTGTALLAAASSLSAAGERLSKAFVAIDESIDPAPTTRLELLRTYVEAAIPDLEAAQTQMERVDLEDLPEGEREGAREIADRLPLLVASMKEFLAFEKMLATILGADGTKKYLAVFQNNSELRATGGFMGSFAETSLSRGELERFSVPGGGTYDLQGSLRRFVQAPRPLRLVNARWEFQDANWFPDFPTSARKILEFYAQAGQGTVDGVIAVNATLVEDLLALTGPVDMPAYGRTITADNFLAETQKIVEQEYDREENRPKAFLGDLAPILLERVLSARGTEFLSLLDELQKALERKDIQVFFADNELEREVRELGWGGEIKATDGDSLMVVDTNVGGGKTDLVIREDVTVDVSIAADGTVTDTVTVTRTHYGTKGAAFSGVNNVDYLRLYVPKGSELLSATGFTIPDASLFEEPLEEWDTDPELAYADQTRRSDPSSNTDIYEEHGKTVFGNWVQTKPGTASKATFVYRLPFRVKPQAVDSWIEKAKKFVGLPHTASYSLVLQKQSGVVDRNTQVRLSFPASFSVQWSTHDPEAAAFTNAQDAFFAALFENAL